MDLIPETSLTKSPDITSIVAAFEARRNPLELFATPRINEELAKKLDTIECQIDDLIAWLTLKKLHLTLHPNDLQTCTNKLTQLQQKLNINFNKSCKTICSRCDQKFNLYLPEDLEGLFNHEHAVKMLTSKSRVFDLTIQETSKKNGLFRCLVCRVLIMGENYVHTHVRGKPHTRKANNRANFARVRNYFEAFEKLPQAFRVFDVIFEPAEKGAPSNAVFCTVCETYVSVGDVPLHVVKNATHSVKFSSTDYSYLNGYDDMLNSFASNPCEVTNASAKVKPEKAPKKVQKKHAVIAAFNHASDSVYNFIPNRLKSHVKYLSGDVNTAVCTLCCVTLNGALNVVAHFAADEHRLKYRQENTLNSTDSNCNSNYYYYCCLCSRHFKKEFKWIAHVNSVGHQQKESLMPKQGVQTNFSEYECSSCLLVWYGHPNTVFAHKRNKFGANVARSKQREVTLSNEMVRLLKDEAAFNADIAKAVKESNDVLSAIGSAHKCCRAIETALAPTFGADIRAYPFGSRVSGLGNIASDLDVFVDIGSMYEGTLNQNAQFQSCCVQQTAAALRRHKDFTDICPIPQARTPIVQVFHKLTDLDCDLSFRHGLSIENTQFLKFCINIQPALRSLILFLKKWVRLNKFRDRISTYGVSLMAIYMLQSRGHLPSLAKLRQLDPQQSKIIAGWETFHFNQPLPEIQRAYPAYQKSERHLLAEFFEFYVNFDFRNDVVCPLLGHPIRKALFEVDKASQLCLPEEMASYVAKLQADENHERIKITKSICIQDPFDLSHNVTKALATEVFLKMTTLMKQSLQLLSP